ncbi:MAG: hypothetical protein FJW90_00960 [Actinobacteria bacterium]|nr:hypothetical protein [Actinomycetota bacterium]
MTAKADFNAEEWETLLQGPPSAGMLVVASDRGGSIRESFSMAKAYAEARESHGASELLDDIVSAKPEMDRSRHGSVEEMKQACAQNLREAMDLLKAKATPEEAEEYRNFVLGLAERVANARREGFMGLSGDRVSDAERAAIGEVAAALA